MVFPPPESLLDACAKRVLRDLDALCVRTADGYALRDGSTLPSAVCRALIDACQRGSNQLTDSFTRLFGDVSRTALTSVSVRGTTDLSDDGLEHLLRHDLTELTLERCPLLTCRTFLRIFEHAENLRSLTVGPNVPIFWFDEHHPNRAGAVTASRGPVGADETAARLERLVIRNVKEWPSDRFVDYMVDQLSPRLSLLRLLDLSNCSGMGVLLFAFKLLNCRLPAIHTLVLHNVQHLQKYDVITKICSLKSLVVLDLSQTVSLIDENAYLMENSTLSTLMECLPNLLSLDISGTNLAGNGEPPPPSVEELSMDQIPRVNRSGIPGLECRVDNPLEFLGLYRTKHDACRRHNIPANIISGNANEDQILNAAASFRDKPDVLPLILADISNLLKHSDFAKKYHALNIISEVLTRYFDDYLIQIAGNIAISGILLDRQSYLSLSTNVKKCIISVILSGLENHCHNREIRRTGLFALYRFEVLLDVMFVFNRLMKVLLYIISNNDTEEFSLYIGIYLLKSLSNQLDQNKKYELENAGVIKKMLVIIDDRTQKNCCDDILEWAWFTIWNLSCDAPKNCERFLDEEGMTYFLGCLTTFPDKNKLIQIMTGLLGHIAELEELRPRLMDVEYIDELSYLSLSMINGFEVSYNATSVIAYLASEGRKGWTLKEPTINAVFHRMTKAFQIWNLDDVRNPHCYSIKPLLKLIQLKHISQCVYWATWTLANLTKVHPECDCLFHAVITDGGFKAMNNLLKQHQEILDKGSKLGPLKTMTKGLAQTVITQCVMYMNGVTDSELKSKFKFSLGDLWEQYMV